MTADAVGGVWTYSLDLARALGARGHRVVLATMGPRPSEAQRAQARAIDGLTLAESDFKLEWMDDPWRDVTAAGDWLLALEREHEPDVVHLNGYAHGVLRWRAPHLVVAHSCVYGWWNAVHGTDPPAEPWARYRAHVAEGLRGARLVVAPTRAMLETLSRHYGAFPAPGIVVPNGRDGGGLRPASQKEPLVVGLGRLWDESKGVGTLDAAAARLPWPVLVAGETRHPEGGDIPPFRHARPLGRLPDADLASLLGRASVFALPARYEPFGLAAVEAALSGCALVLSDLATLREVWGEAALYAPPGDAAALHGALRALIEDEPRRRRLAAAARARALALTPRRMADGYARAYERLILSAGRARGKDEEETACAS